MSWQEDLARLETVLLKPMDLATIAFHTEWSYKETSARIGVLVAGNKLTKIERPGRKFLFALKQKQKIVEIPARAEILPSLSLGDF